MASKRSVGVLGGGQLGRMLIEAAHAMGKEIALFFPLSPSLALFVPLALLHTLFNAPLLWLRIPYVKHILWRSERALMKERDQRTVDRRPHVKKRHEERERDVKKKSHLPLPAVIYSPPKGIASAAHRGYIFRVEKEWNKWELKHEKKKE